MSYMPAWAVQGPFPDGKASGQALKEAITRLAPTEKLERLLNFVPGHMETFDQNPEGWEEIRQLIFGERDENHAKLFLTGREVLSERLWQTTDTEERKFIFQRYRAIDELLSALNFPFEWSKDEKKLEAQLRED